MKRECIKYIIGFFVIILTISFITAQNIPNDLYPITVKVEGSLYKTINKNISENITTVQTFMKTLLSSSNSITDLYPVEGYYYITDRMLLYLLTSNPSTCTYTYNGQTKNIIDNLTEHYEYISGLTDNMMSDTPYLVDFSCNDGSSTITASTYFWINTTDLDKYFLRSNQGSWNYLNSENYYDENDSFSLGSYRSLYQKNAGQYDTIVVKIFDSKTSMNKYIDTDNETIKTIGDKNFFIHNETDINAVAWTSGNYLVMDIVFAYQNTTPASLDIPNDILNPYLAKYPNDLRNGVCGNGKIDIFNLDGKKEECDKNSQTQICGSNIGECKQGTQVRKCRSDCTWEGWGACNDTKPKQEICDGKDNNCDSKIDETFLLLGQTCNVGVGACKTSGTYICSSDGINVTCNTKAKNSTKEICNDGIDNDCDSKVDFNDTNDCTLLKINSPIKGFNYSSKNILLDIYSDLNPCDISYSYFDSHGKLLTIKLCSKCNSFNKTKSFNDGLYNVTIAISNKTQIFYQKQLYFLIDATIPKISETLPKKGFTNGNFSIDFKEDNPKTLILIYDKFTKKLDLKKECSIDKGIWSCTTKVNLSNIEGKEIYYSFNLTDIMNKTISSKPIILIVDTTLPKVKINWTSSKGKVDFIFNITEINLDEINYIDSFDGTRTKWNSISSRLDKNNNCVAKKSFKTGTHNLTVQILDKAGNSIQENISFNI